MKEKNELSYRDLKIVCNQNMFNFETTEELEPINDGIGQDRGIKALEFGINVNVKGYNIYIEGPSGVGKTMYAKNYLDSIAPKKKVPNDWCYIYNFQNPNEPIAVSLPAGQGKEFKNVMDQFIKDIKNDISSTFNNEDFEKEKTLISIKARNISEKAFVSSTWSMDGIREFMSNKMITPKEEVTINAQINIPTDRAAIKLISLEEYEGERIDLSDKRQISIPPKHAISSLFKDDRFSFFMSDLKKKEGVDAEWLYMEDGTSSSWLCPKCGIPVYKDENCPLCGIEREKAKTFSASSLTLLFDKAKEN